MIVLPSYFKIISFPIYYLIHYNYLFGIIHKTFFKTFNYKKFKFSLNNLKFPTSSYSSFLWKTYELNDRVLIERNLKKKHKCIIIGGGIGFIGVLTFHLTKNKIILFEINKELINLLNSNLKRNYVKFELFENNLTLEKNFKKNSYFTSENFAINSIFRKSKKKSFFKNIHFSKINNFNLYNTLIIDGEGIEKHYIDNLNKIRNIRYIFFEFHHDIFDEKKKTKIFNQLKKNRFFLKDKFVNSYFFEKR